MKKIFFLSIFAMSFFATTWAAVTEVYIYKDPIPPGPIAISAGIYPVSAYIDGDQLQLIFDHNIGVVSMGIYDSSNNLIEQTNIDTSGTLEKIIALTDFESGAYYFRIRYNSTSLKGDFTVE